MSTPPAENELSLKISDVYTLSQAFEKAMKAKAFDKDTTMEVYPVWSRVMRFCEDVKRRTEINDLYSEEAKAAELAAADVSEVPSLVESPVEIVEVQSE
jgi:hypothetical protein